MKAAANFQLQSKFLALVSAVVMFGSVCYGATVTGTVKVPMALRLWARLCRPATQKRK